MLLVEMPRRGASRDAPSFSLVEMLCRDGSRDACGGARALPLLCLLASCLVGAYQAGLWAGWRVAARPFSVLADPMALYWPWDSRDTAGRAQRCACHQEERERENITFLDC